MLPGVSTPVIRSFLPLSSKGSDLDPGDPLLQVGPGLAYGPYGLGVGVGDLGVVRLLEGHDQLHEVEGVGLQVVGEAGLVGDLLEVNFQLVGDDLATLLTVDYVGHSFSSCCGRDGGRGKLSDEPAESPVSGSK